MKDKYLELTNEEAVAEQAKIELQFITSGVLKYEAMAYGEFHPSHSVIVKSILRLTEESREFCSIPKELKPFLSECVAIVATQLTSATTFCSYTSFFNNCVSRLKLYLSWELSLKAKDLNKKELTNANKKLDLLQKKYGVSRGLVNCIKMLNMNTTCSTKLSEDILNQILGLFVYSDIVVTKDINNHKHIRLSNNIIENVVNKVNEIKYDSLISYKPLVATPVLVNSYINSGGYYSNLITFNLIKDNSCSKLYQNQDYTKLYTVINTLNSVEWQINNEVLAVVNYINTNYRNLNNSLRNILNIAEEIDLDSEEYLSLTKYERFLLHQANKIKLSKMYSEQTSIQTANEYVKYSKFYITYQCDYRGRIYPIQQSLNFQKGSLEKGLLRFSEGKKLETEDSTKWWKIHGANVYGYDKLTFEDRISKIEEMHNDILKYAKAPCINLGWTKVDAPLEFLAWCFEYRRWTEDPLNFESRLCVQMDATCSGTQLYSLLFNDSEGAAKVNVINHLNSSGKVSRADIYQSVANKVKDIILDNRINKDYSSTIDEEGNYSNVTLSKDILKFILENINRSWTKANVMTLVYNSTLRGRQAQNVNILKEKFSDLSTKEILNIATVLTALIEQAISEVVASTLTGQKFLNSVCKAHFSNKSNCSNLVPLVYKHSLGFNCYQLNKEYKDTRIKTPFCELRVRDTSSKATTNVKLNSSAFAPNFIHSLDSGLLGNVILKDSLMSYGVIHDCIAVHAADCEQLHRNIRSSAKEMFENKDILKNLLSGNNLELDIPEFNKFDIDEVTKAKYFFS